MNSTTITVELDGVEFNIEFEYDYLWTPARTVGRPEDCYPSESDFSWEIIDQPSWLNAIESWELEYLDEDVFYYAAMDDIQSMKADYGDFLYDQMRDAKAEAYYE